MITSKPVLSEDDLKEVFSLFTSSTEHERKQVYATDSGHHYLDMEISEEYSLTQEKREYALDAWRAVMYFLHRKGYSLYKEGKVIDLSFTEDEFVA